MYVCVCVGNAVQPHLRKTIAAVPLYGSIVYLGSLVSHVLGAKSLNVAIPSLQKRMAFVPSTTRQAARHPILAQSF